MKLDKTQQELRRLLDMAYIGHWILTATRGEDLLGDYDRVESLLFQKAFDAGMDVVTEHQGGIALPSRAFVEGGIHEAIMDYENNVFFDILAEDLARRDMHDAPIDAENFI